MSYFSHFFNKKQGKNPKDPQILSPEQWSKIDFFNFAPLLRGQNLRKNSYHGAKIYFFSSGPWSEFAPGQNIIVAPPKIMFFSSPDEFFVYTKNSFTKRFHSMRTMGGDTQKLFMRLQWSNVP